jgi:hypothetical protein
LDPTFGSFILLEPVSHLREPVSLVKMFTLFRLERIVLGVHSVNTVGRCTNKYIGREGQTLLVRNQIFFPLNKIGPLLHKCVYIVVFCGSF